MFIQSFLPSSCTAGPASVIRPEGFRRLNSWLLTCRRGCERCHGAATVPGPWQMCCRCAWGDAVDVWGHEVKREREVEETVYEAMDESGGWTRTRQQLPLSVAGLRLCQETAFQSAAAACWEAAFTSAGQDPGGPARRRTAAGRTSNQQPATSACHWELWEGKDSPAPAVPVKELERQHLKATINAAQRISHQIKKHFMEASSENVFSSKMLEELETYWCSSIYQWPTGLKSIFYHLEDFTIIQFTSSLFTASVAIENLLIELYRKTPL